LSVFQCSAFSFYENVTPRGGLFYINGQNPLFSSVLYNLYKRRRGTAGIKHRILTRYSLMLHLSVTQQLYVLIIKTLKSLLCVANYSTLTNHMNFYLAGVIKLGFNALDNLVSNYLHFVVTYYIRFYHDAYFSAGLDGV